MPTSMEIRQKVQDYKDSKLESHYTGPTVYRGHEINMKHSISRVTTTILKLLMKTQFASINIIGIPGSGKTSFAVNLFTDLMQRASRDHKLNFSFDWWNADDLRNLGQKIDELPKGQDHIRVCDDVSKALDQLSSKDQAEVFQQLTTTRHTTGGKLCLASLYHYTFANLKSIKSQAIVNVYTSISLIEKLNIMAMLGKDPQSIQRLNSFMKVYQESIDHDSFQLKTFPNQNPPKTFYDWKPFHPCFVVNLFKAHLSLFMRVEDSPLWPKDKMKYSIPVPELFEKGRKAYAKDFDHAMSIIAAQNGHFNKNNVNFGRAYNYVQKLRRTYHWSWNDVMEEFKAKQLKRIQKNRKIEKEMDAAFAKLATFKPDTSNESEENKIG
jgi:hypothetical protein